MKHFFILAVLAASAAGTADDYPYLDAPYQKRDPLPLSTPNVRARAKKLPVYSDIARAIAVQSKVKSQGRRGTCAIFSATALTEFWVGRSGGGEWDLSEEFLQYLAGRTATSEGSNSYRNISNLLAWGLPKEETMRYVGQTWTSLETSPLSMTRCGHVPESIRPSCLVSHYDPRFLYATDRQLRDAASGLYDPDFADARQEAVDFRNAQVSQGRMVMPRSIEEVKQWLAAGIPVLLDLPVYYGAWNHGAGLKIGIPVDNKAYLAGTVGYPEMGSLDRANSSKDSAGHSVLVVGYDDEYETETETKMEDGSVQKFKYRGAFIFKNSWGTTAFGVNFTWRGNAYPGYGAITARYAQEFGSFTTLYLP